MYKYIHIYIYTDYIYKLPEVFWRCSFVSGEIALFQNFGTCQF